MKTTMMRRAEIRIQNSEARRNISPLVRYIVTAEKLAQGAKPPPGRSGRIQWIQPEIGDVVTVRSMPGAYRLPMGLPEGAQVRVVRRDGAYFTVERDGWEWCVYMMNMECRYEWV